MTYFYSISNEWTVLSEQDDIPWDREFDQRRLHSIWASPWVEDHYWFYTHRHSRQPRPCCPDHRESSRLPADPTFKIVCLLSTSWHSLTILFNSTLYFDCPEGFGEWCILVSQDAHSNLREFHRRSKKSFNIIVKKIRFANWISYTSS